MNNIDSLINAAWVIPMDTEDTVLTEHSIAVHEGRIVEILATDVAKQKYLANSNHNLATHALIPGLINSHTHASMSLFRGLADDLPLMVWLQDHIWPAEGQWVDSEFVKDGTILAVAEMIKSGTTCFNDMYFFPDETARQCDAIGMRATIGLILLDFPTIWANDADEYIHKGVEIHDHFRNNSLISTAFAPHAPYTVSDEPLEKVVILAEELDVPIHIHVHETLFEVNDAVQRKGSRPLFRLQNLGVASPRLAAVHMTQLNDEDINIIMETGSNIVHCPESNLKLASGYCPVAKLLDCNVNVALGTDGSASNNDLDMLGEMRSAALMAKNVANNASAVPAMQALRMATINGAKALGLDHLIGSLEKGKAADIVAVDLHDVATQPLYNPVSQLVYASSRQQVTDVWIAGKQLLNNRVLTTIDQEQAIAKAREWSIRIQQSDKVSK